MRRTKDESGTPHGLSVGAALFSFSLVLFSTTHALALELPVLAERTKPAVVLITLFDESGEKIATGTGFFASTDGRLVTNFHVIRDGAKATAKLSDGRELPIRGVLAEDPLQDIAILEVAGDSFPALTLGDSALVRPGDEVAVIGSPLGLSATISSGIVSAVREKGLADDSKERSLLPPAERGDTVSWGIQITAAISPGSSGSPIMTRDGDVIAVAVGTRVDGQAVNFGVPIQVTKTLLAELGDKPTIKPFAVASHETIRKPSHQVLRNLGISAAFFAGLGLLYLVVSRFAEWRRRSARGRTIREQRERR